MSRPQFFALASMVYVAPTLPQVAGLGVGVVFVVISLAFAIVEWERW